MEATSGPVWPGGRLSAKARPNTSLSRISEMSVFIAHQAEVPMAVRDIAIQHRADQLAVTHHDLLVETTIVVAQGDLVVIAAFRPSGRRPRTHRHR
jgi:hypothetical protein